jgi:hypothetical protein
MYDQKSVSLVAHPRNEPEPSDLATVRLRLLDTAIMCIRAAAAADPEEVRVALGVLAHGAGVSFGPPNPATATETRTTHSRSLFASLRNLFRLTAPVA